jgi:hypothetical protein
VRERTPLEAAAFVEEDAEALPGCEHALPVLALNPIRPAQGEGTLAAAHQFA